ncbi:MAG: ROK family protein [Alphaproteobacteria bacterium]|nr:ROK family protein [Alphaproteobacteria bacterium]
MRIGVDMGGTKIEVLALGRDGRELARRRRPTPRAADPQASYEAIVAAVAETVAEVEQAAGGGQGSVGVGIPGAISPATGLVKNANTTCLIGRPLDRDLARVLGRPVRLANDANCFALSEASDGAAAGAGVVLGVILGTGVGGGIVVDGRALSGRNAIAGEWGHNPLPWPDPDERPGGRFCRPCYCGKEGCIETFLSGPGLAADHRAATGEALSPDAIARRAGTGDAAARASLDRYVDRAARAMATVINMVDPDAIVLGGGLSNLALLYQEIPQRWGRYSFSDRIDTPLLPPRHGDASGVRGAAWLWPLERGP